MNVCATNSFCLDFFTAFAAKGLESIVVPQIIVELCLFSIITISK
jgi:hypothetical protein